MPTIAALWIKNNILAALISAAVSLCIYGVRQATGAADGDAGPGGLVLLYAVTAILWAFAGSADGLLTGAVLQRIIPLLPARTWIGLHIVLAVTIGMWSEFALMRSSTEPASAGDVSAGEMLAAALISGAVLGAAIGGLQALVLRKAAIGSGAWVAWSVAAFAVAASFLALGASLWNASSGFGGELVNQVLSFLAAVIIALVMLQALQGLKDPVLSRAGQHFS